MLPVVAPPGIVQLKGKKCASVSKVRRDSYRGSPAVAVLDAGPMRTVKQYTHVSGKIVHS